MAGTSWLVDSRRIATKIKSASGTEDPDRVEWKSNPTRACPNCNQLIDNTDVVQEWPGLPRGVKFDPSDQETIWHLLAKSGVENNLKPHPFIDEFIPTVEKEDGICYTHPQNLPGVKQDGSASHFFHRAVKAYKTGTRKRRKISYDDFSGDVRWHKTGRTKPVLLDGKTQKGCKKIMVLYSSSARGSKLERTNWKMHQYHLGTEEDEKDGEYVVSKIFYDQKQIEQGEKNEPDFLESVNEEAVTVKVNPVTPEPPRIKKRCVKDTDMVKDSNVLEKEEENGYDVNPMVGNQTWWDSESQNLLDSQQLLEGLSLCADLLQGQISPNREDENENSGAAINDTKGKDYLSYYARLGPEELKKDLEECGKLVLDPANIELDTSPEFQLSQLEFGSQDSFLAWGGKAV